MSNTTLQFKQRQADTEEAPPRWNIGIDRRRVAMYVALALMAGFAGGFLAARSTTRKEASPPVLNRDNRPAAQKSASESTQIEYHRVSRIVRADTIEVESLGVVRMIGIETPDGKSPEQIYGVHGQRALSFVEKALLGQEVRLDYDDTGNRGGSGTASAYVYTRDGRLINGEMVKQGLALVRSAEQFRLASDFRGYEREAMQSMRGLWGSSSSAGGPSTASSRSPLQDDKTRKLAPMPPSALGENIPALTTPANASSEQSVWVSPGDKMYHKSMCDFLNKKKHALALSQARSDGYTACSRCYASTVMKAP